MYAGAVVLLAWVTSGTRWAEQPLYFRLGPGKPLPSNYFFRIHLPGILYWEDGSYLGLIWGIDVRRSAPIWIVAAVAVVLLMGSVWRGYRSNRRRRGARC